MCCLLAAVGLTWPGMSAGRKMCQYACLKRRKENFHALFGLLSLRTPASIATRKGRRGFESMFCSIQHCVLQVLGISVWCAWKEKVPAVSSSGAYNHRHRRPEWVQHHHEPKTSKRRED